MSIYLLNSNNLKCGFELNISDISNDNIKNENVTKMSGKKVNKKESTKDKKETCVICLDKIHPFNLTKCERCNEGNYHKECLGYWFYKEKLHSSKNKKLRHCGNCTICDKKWNDKDIHTIKKIYNKAHQKFIQNNNTYKRKLKILSPDELYVKRLAHYKKKPRKKNKSKTKDKENEKTNHTEKWWDKFKCSISFKPVCLSTRIHPLQDTYI